MTSLPDFRSFARLRGLLFVGASALSVASSTLNAADQRTYIGSRSNADVPAGYAFSDAVLVGDTLYLSGHLGLDPNRQLPADPEIEARHVLDNVKATLHAAGMSMDDLVSVTITCTDLSLYARFNAIYKSYFKKEFPARAFLGTDRLLFGARFEVVGIAVKRKP
ncbi:MAG TPA: Rid family hydrolase [Opitutaceae bacterium]|nr:Rid family hydrolase [Opitutaceae bacterium]